MKDSKLVLTLCSVLALAACGGGSGGSGAPAISGGSSISAPVTPTNTISTTDYRTVENPNVNSNNTSVTNMGSYSVTNAAAVHTAMVDYVSDRLGGDVYTTDNYNALNLGRGASIRSGAKVGLTDEQKFAIADAKINQMKNIIADLTNAATDEARLEYVTTNRAAVADALMLFTNGVNAETPVEDLITTFDGLNITNLQAAFDNFDSTNSFVYNKEMLNEVDFVVTGGDETILRFGMDGNGKITSVTPGHEVLGTWTPLSEIGQLDRNGATNTFAGTVHDYTLDITDLFNTLAGVDSANGGFAFLTSSLGGLSQVKQLHVRSAETLTDEQVRDALLAEFDARKTKFLSGQDDHSNDAAITEDFAKLRAAITTETPADYDTLWTTAGHTPDNFGDYWNHVGNIDVNLTATLTGVGKDLGTKLRFSDFGYIETYENGHIAQFMPYTGGYTSRNVDMATVASDTTVTYTGTAIAGLDAKGQDSQLLRQNDAQLVFNGSNGKSVLTMDGLKYSNNKDWYTMVVTGKPNSDLSFSFDKDGKTIENGYRFYGDTTANGAFVLDQAFVTDGVLGSGVQAHDGEFSLATGTPEDTTSVRGYAEVNYYGENTNTPASEATAGFNFAQEHISNGSTTDEIVVYGAFGGVQTNIENH